MSFSDPLDTSVPVGGASVSGGDDQLRRLSRSVQEVLNVDHTFDIVGNQVNSADSGTHQKLTLIEQSSAPTAISGVTDYGFLYTRNDSDTGQAELFWKDEATDEIQFTKGNALVVSNVYLPNDTYIDGESTVSDTFVDMIKVDTSNQVVIFQTATEPAKLATTDPPLADADISNKKYVDDNIGVRQSEIVSDTTNLSTSSTSFVDMTGITKTITTTGGNILVMFNTTFVAGGGNDGVFQIMEDGVSKTIGGDGSTTQGSSTGNITLNWLSTSLSAGSHTFKVQWKTNSGTLDVDFAKASDNPTTTFIVIEI